MHKPVSIFLGWRDDGGLQIWSDDMPGLILSGPDPAKVMASVLPAIAALREHAAGTVVNIVNHDRC